MSETDRPRARRRKKRSRVNMTPVFVSIVFIVIVLFAVILSIFIKKYSPSKERVNLQEYYHLQAEDDMALILDQQLIEDTAKYWDGQVYLKYETVQMYLNQRFYWDFNENILRYTTDSDVISVNAGENSYMEGKKNNTEAYTIVRVDGEAVYLALEFVQKYTNMDFVQYAEPNRAVITAAWGEISKAAVKKDTQIRVRGGIKSPVVSDVKKGSSVIVIENGDKWSRVCT